MSKEREMIEKLCSFQMTYSDWLLLIADAEELLAQPEQEPVAWITEWQDKQVSGSIWSTQTKRALSFTREGAMVVLHPNYIPLYLVPPKREPLDNVEIMTIAAEHAWDLKRFARAIEKAHGIGECNSHYKERHETFGEEV